MSRNKLHIVIWSLLDVGLYPVFYLLTIPYFMNTMGTELFGIWMLISAIMVMGQLLSMGLGTATYRNVSRFLADRNTVELSRTISTNIMTSLAISLVCFALAGGLCVGIRYAGWFEVPAMYQSMVLYALVLSVPFLVMKFIEQILQNVIKSYERFLLAYMLNMCSRFGVLMIYVCLVAYGIRDIGSLIAAGSAFLALLLVVYAISINRIDPTIRFIPAIDLKRIKEEVTYGWWIWLQSLFVIITYQGDRLLVMSFFGPGQLAFYTIVSTMFNHIHMCYSALAPWMFPRITKMNQHGLETPQEYFNIRGYVMIIAISTLWLFSVLHPYLLPLWLGDQKYSMIKEYVTLFILFELFFIFTIVPSLYCNSTGNEQLFTRLTLVFSAINFFGMLLGYFFSGTIMGLIWGLVISTVPAMFILNMMLNNWIFNRPAFEEWVMAFVPSVCIGLSILLSGFLVKAIFLISGFYFLYRFYFSSFQYAYRKS